MVADPGIIKSSKSPTPKADDLVGLLDIIKTSKKLKSSYNF